MKYIIGIDNGSQSTKVAIYDLSGNIVSEGRQALLPYDLPNPGQVLHPKDDLWDSIVGACNIAIGKFNGDLNDIIGVGLCTIRCCRAFVKADGELAYPIQSWMDVRMSENYDHSIEDVRWVTTTSGYITMRLTGEHIDTAANYVGPWPINYETWDWIEDEAKFNEFNVPREMLFDLVKPNDFLGVITESASKLTGIPQGLKVFASANDKAVEALGAGLLRDDTVLLSLGTYICAMMQGNGIYPNSQSFWTNFADLPNKYLYETGGIRRGMWTISWVRDLIFDHNLINEDTLGVCYEEFLNNEAKLIPPGCNGLFTMLDFLAPVDKPYKKGFFIGLDGRHTRGHMYKSVLEAIAMTMKINIDQMVDELKTTPKQITVTGGGSNSDLMMQVVADVFGIKAIRNEINGCASLGAAINTAIGLGEFDNFALATEKMVRVKDTFEPNMENHEQYKKIISDIYIDLFSLNDEVLKKIYNMFE